MSFKSIKKTKKLQVWALTKGVLTITVAVSYDKSVATRDCTECEVSETCVCSKCKCCSLCSDKCGCPKSVKDPNQQVARILGLRYRYWQLKVCVVWWGLVVVGSIELLCHSHSQVRLWQFFLTFLNTPIHAYICNQVFFFQDVLIVAVLWG